jgi:hypothetical protein
MQGRRPRLVLSRMLFRKSFRDRMHRAALEQNEAEGREKKERVLHALDGLTSATRNRNSKNAGPDAQSCTAFRIDRLVQFRDFEVGVDEIDPSYFYLVAITAVATEGGNG